MKASFLACVLCLCLQSSFSQQVASDQPEDIVWSHTCPEIGPCYRGGHQALIRFICANFRYPPKAEKAGIKGEALVQFAIDTNGKVVNCCIAKSARYDLDQEALRVIRLSKNWIPGTQGGRKTLLYLSQPFIFVTSGNGSCDLKKKHPIKKCACYSFID